MTTLCRRGPNCERNIFRAEPLKKHRGSVRKMCRVVLIVNGAPSNPPCQLVGVAVARGVNFGYDREARNAGDASEDKARRPRRGAAAAVGACDADGDAKERAEVE